MEITETSISLNFNEIKKLRIINKGDIIVITGVDAKGDDIEEYRGKEQHSITK